MSEMDWETSSPPFPPSHNAGALRCPYRMPGDGANTFQYQVPHSQSQGLITTTSFGSTQASPQGFWNNPTQQTMPPREGMDNRFSQVHGTSIPPVRTPEASSFDYNMNLDGRSHHSAQARQSRFEPTNQSIRDRSGSYPSGTAQSPATGTGTGSEDTSNQPSGSGLADLSSAFNYNHATIARRHGSVSSIPFEPNSATLPNSPSRHLPPPNSAYHGTYREQNIPYHQHSRLRSGSIGTQSKFFHIKSVLVAVRKTKITVFSFPSWK